MKAFAFAVMALLSSVCFSQDWAKSKLAVSPRHGEWIEVKNGSRAVKAFVTYPEIKDKAPVVVLIHEIFGMTDWVQLMADELAERGFIVVAPDLLSGMGPGGGRTDSIAEDKVREAISGLPADQITGDLNACVDYALTIPSGNGKVAVAGFCWGGGQSFRFATNNAKIQAAFVFYGPPPASADLAKIKAPVYGFYGENDNRINATIPDTEKAMTTAGKTYEPVIYKGAGHGFMRAGQAPEASTDNAKGWKDGFERLVSKLAALRG